MSHARIAEARNWISLYFREHPAFLVGWEEIEQYLGSPQRSVRRWRQLYGFPVRRRGANVVLDKRELDRWIVELDRIQRQPRSYERRLHLRPQCGLGGGRNP